MVWFGEVSIKVCLLRRLKKWSKVGCRAALDRTFHFLFYMDRVSIYLVAIDVTEMNLLLQSAENIELQDWYCDS
jgi:hypothetical protein